MALKKLFYKLSSVLYRINFFYTKILRKIKETLMNKQILSNKKTILSVITLTILSLFLFTGCLGGSDKTEWTSLIYPDKENTKRSKKYGVYPSLEECRKASLLELSNLGLSETGTYQCGLNCNYHEGMKVEICEKTSK